MKLAARNLWRNRRRTAVTFSALALGIAVLIFVDSFASGFYGVGLRNVIELQSGEIQVFAPGYFAERDNLPLSPLLPGEAALQAALAAPGVRAAAPRVMVNARLHVGWEEFPVRLIGADPALDGEVFDLAPYLEGRFPEPGAAEAVIGAGLARLLEIGPGDWVLLIARTRENAFQALDVQVTGTLWTPNPEVNENQVYVPLSFLDRELSLAGGVTVLSLLAEDPGRLEAVAAGVQEALAGAGVAAEAFSWEEAAADLVAMMQADVASNVMISGIILVIALIGVTNTILLGAIERRREIGMMKAMGMREREIVALFLLEATGIAALAICVGFAAGTLINVYMVNVGLDIDAMLGDLELGIPVLGRVHGAWNASVYVWAAAAALIACWAAAYFPASRAARLDAAETARG